MLSKSILKLVVLLACVSGFSAPAHANSISGPFVSDNLAIYLIHGSDQIKDQRFLTLSEALQLEKVKVYETSNVNQLSIENLSRHEYIYIQAGDIVKGGKQDRVFSNDMVLVPNSGKQKIGAFCVESGRWHRRGSESAHEFHSSNKRLASKELRLAARLKQNQSDVWQEVDKVQKKLNQKLGADVRSEASASSLQLALENKKLHDREKKYIQDFGKLLEHKTHVIGYAFAVNGILNSADIYASQALLKKLWPKIVDAAAAESIADYDNSFTGKIPSREGVQAWMKRASSGRQSEKQLKPGLSQVTIESQDDVRFDTYSGTGDEKKLYRQSYIKK